MPQMQLPLFPTGVTQVNSLLGFEKKGGQVTYYYGQLPVFQHSEDDIRSFKMITAQFCITGGAKQAEIHRAFGVTRISVKRSVKRYREGGPGAFFAPRRRRGAAVLTPPVLKEAQRLLDEELSVSEVAEKLRLKRDTLAKAVLAGRLHKRSSAPSEVNDVNRDSVEPSTAKSHRSIDDSNAAMGMGATNQAARLAAACGALEPVEVKFEPCLDVPNGGVLLAVAPLLTTGLLRHTAKYFELPRGYYGLPSIFLLLAFLALCRVRSVERLRFLSPGEWGKLLGLDRIPEVRTLRSKLALLAVDNQPLNWSAELCADWMQAEPSSAGVLYVDGHVRVYHGNQTKLPRHHVSRQKLCLRATTDYWVNAMDGQPFFVINQAVDPGMLQVLRNEIVPRLEREVPGQPSQQELEDDEYLHCFTIVFDREGYSPEFFSDMKERRIACLTYHKYPGDDWHEDEFVSHPVRLVSGELVEMRLAERGTLLRPKLWVREIRKLTASGHQTSILSTDYRSDLAPISAAMFARWSQENFFRYMRQHYGLDRLVDYNTEELPDTTRVVNPAHRKLDGQVRRKAAILSRRRAQFGALTIDGEIAPAKMEAYQQKMAALQEEIEHLMGEVAELKKQRKNTARHIQASELSEEDQFRRLSTQSKHFIDTIKMIAYRAETAMVHVLREKMSRHDDGRSLLRAIYETEADLLPNESDQTLTVRLHHLASKSSGNALQHICTELNAAEIVFPGTNLRMVYELLGEQNRAGKDV